jgi:type I restriction enzyme S subunit
MKQKEKTALKQMVPELRFPEFKDAGDWEEKNLGQVLMGSPQYGLNAASVPFNDNLPAYLRITDISDEGLFLSEKKVSVDYLPKEEDYLHDGDIVLARTGASVGKAYKYRSSDGKLVYAGYLIRIQPDPKKTNSSFLFNYFFTPYYWKWVSVVSSRSGQPGINGSEYSSFPISFPSLPEQQKIADCLSSLDEVISLESQKLQSLQSYKKGLLQNLFPAEGETAPKLRFPEFVGTGDWEERKLGDVCELTLRSVDKPKQGYLGLGVRSHGKGTFQKLEQDPKANSMDVLYQVHENDLIVSITFAWEGAVAIASKEDQGGLVSHRFPTYVFKPEETSSNFFRYIITKKSFVYKLGLISPGGAGRNRVMNKKDFLELKEYFPSLPEQQKIADCISSVDALIQAQSERVEGLKSHKKGLLHGLFPVMGDN